MVLERVDRDASAVASPFADEVAFRAWYERTLPRVYGYVFHRCGGSHEVAEEITQQAFVEAVRQRSRFRGEADPATWVTAIARRRLADHYRRLERAERGRLRLVVGELAIHRESSLERHAERDDILRVLRAMPIAERAAFVFRHVDGLPVGEVAQLIGRTEKATESLLGRARGRFRSLYGEEIDA